MRATTLQDEGVPGRESVHELSPMPPPAEGYHAGGEVSNGRAGWMGLVRWRCQRHGHPKEQNFYGISV